MTRKKKTAILFLILLGVALLPLFFLKVWASYRLGEVNSQQTPQGTLISQEMQARANTPPEGKNLFEHPLWADNFKERYALYKGLSGRENITATGQLFTNALSIWYNEQSTKNFQYSQFEPSVDKKVVPRPGNLDSTQRELLPTFEALQKGPEKASSVPVSPELSSIIGKYEVREDISDEEKVLAVFLEYFQSGDPATEEEIKKSLAESSYLGISEEVYTRQGFKEEDFLTYPIGPLPILKTLAQYYGYTALWCAYSGQREKTLEELKPLLDMASLEGYNSTLIEGLVRNATRSISATTVHSLILENVLNQEDLLSIQTRFSRINMMEDLWLTLEGEEVYCGKMFKAHFDPALRGGFWERSFARLARLSGYLDLNKAAVLDMTRGLRATIDTEGQTLDYAAWSKVADMPKSIFNILARQMIPAFGKASNAFLRGQSYRDAVILGCALERYRMKEGSFPEKLEALIPEYLPEMPPGSLSQGSLTYNRTEKGYELILNKLPDLPADARMETIWRR